MRKNSARDRDSDCIQQHDDLFTTMKHLYVMSCYYYNVNRDVHVCT